MAPPRNRDGSPAPFVFLLLIAVATGVLLPGAVRGAAPSLYLHMIGEPALSSGGTPVLVAGIWHEVDVNLTARPSQSVTLEAVLPGASPSSPSNTYEWSYDPASGAWTDVLYGQFIRSDLSVASGDQVTFVVGIDAAATTGTWTLSATLGTSPVTSESLEVQSPFVSYGLSAPDITFRVDPFQSAQLSTQGTGEYLRTINEGNVPLGLRVTFDTLGSALSLANPASVAHVSSEAQYFFDLNLGALPPQVITVTGHTNVTPLFIVPSAGSSRITATVQQPFTVVVTVGRSGYAVRTVGGVVFQTLNSVSATYGSMTTWQVYLTGAQNITINAAASGVRLLSLASGAQPLTLPATLALSAASELPLTVQIEATSAGAITFTLHLLGTGDTQTFTTQVSVSGGPADRSAGTVTLLWIAGAALTAAVFGFVSFNTVRHRRRVAAADNDKPAKKGYNARRAARAQSRGRQRGNHANGKARSNGAGQGPRDPAPTKGARRP